VEVVRNVNYCHSLTVLYHEVLRHVRVDTRLANVRVSESPNAMHRVVPSMPVWQRDGQVWHAFKPSACLCMLPCPRCIALPACHSPFTWGQTVCCERVIPLAASHALTMHVSPLDRSWCMSRCKCSPSRWRV
jgi:hypothetical protein